MEKINEAINAKKLQEEQLQSTNAKFEKVDHLRKEKAELLKTLRLEKEKLEKELEKVNVGLKQLSPGEGNEAIQRIEENYDLEEKKLLAKKAEIAEKNKQINLLQRKIQQCPSRTELAQYITRFTELYEQVNRRNEENKKYIILYNTLLSTHNQLKDRLERAIDAKDGYKTCKSKKEKEKYLKLLNEIVNDLNGNVSKLQTDCQKIAKDREAMQKTLDDYILKERNYYRMQSDLYKEIARSNELKDAHEKASAAQPEK